MYQSDRLELEGDTGETVRKLLGVAAFQDETEGVAEIQAETAEAAPAESELVLVPIKFHSGNTGEATGVELYDPAQIETQHQPRGYRKIRLTRIQRCNLAVAEITAQLQAAVQVAGTEVRHGDIAGKDGADTRAVTALNGNELGTGLVRLGGKGVQGSGNRDRNRRQK